MGVREREGGGFGSIYRRSSVVKLKSKRPPTAEYALLRKATAEALGVYPNAESLKEFLEPRPADAYLKFIFEFANSFTTPEPAGVIGDYASCE